jgi:hypothetical protein
MTRATSAAILLMAIVFSSCNKDPDQKGCTDPIALNYDPSALKDDGSCQFNDAEQFIWSEGNEGGWNNDLIEGAFRHVVCEGTSEVMEEVIDSATTRQTLYLGPSGVFSHRSYFTVINERDARDFAEGSLRFDARVSDTEDGSPDYIRLFISGKIWESETCEPYRRSEYVEISTHSFNDPTFTPVNVTIREFEEIMMARVWVVGGFEFEGDRSTGIEIDNLRWVANDLD